MQTNMLDQYNDHGQTALHVAEVNRHVELADLLVTSGAQSLPTASFRLSNISTVFEV